MATKLVQKKSIDKQSDGEKQIKFQYHPSTRIDSYKEFIKRGQAKSIKDLIVKFLAINNGKGFSCRQLSEILGVEVQSLTYPIKTLMDDGTICCNYLIKCSTTGRLVMAYETVKF